SQRLRWRKAAICAANRPRSSFAALESAEDRDRLAGTDLDDRLLPASRVPRGVAAPLGLGLHPGGADVDHADLEQLLDRLAHLGLVGAVVHPEGVLARLRERKALLRDHRADDHLGRLHQAAAPSDSRVGLAARATSPGSAASEISSEEAHITSETPTSWTGIAYSRTMLRNDFPAAASSAPSTTRTGPAGSQSFSRPTAWAVEGSLNADASNAAIDPRSACRDRALRSALRRSLRLTLNV